MKLKIVYTALAAVICAGFWGVAQAAYDHSNFDEAVNLQRFRKGNPEWDTQELIASGLRALHQENMEILRELGDLRKKVEQLEGKQ